MLKQNQARKKASKKYCAVHRLHYIKNCPLCAKKINLDNPFTIVYNLDLSEPFYMDAMSKGFIGGGLKCR